MTIPPARRLWSIGLWAQYRHGLIGPDQVEAGWESEPPAEFVRAVAELVAERGPVADPPRR